MTITKIKLLGADNKIKTISINGKIDNPFDFIKETEFSDHKVVAFEQIDIGILYSCIQPERGNIILHKAIIQN